MTATVLTRMEGDAERMQIQRGSVEDILGKAMPNKACVINSGDPVIRISKGKWIVAEVNAFSLAEDDG